MKIQFDQTPSTPTTFKDVLRIMGLARPLLVADPNCNYYKFVEHLNLVNYVRYPHTVFVASERGFIYDVIGSYQGAR